MFGSSGIRFDAQPVVHSDAELLLASEVALSRLDRHVAEQELDLIEFAAGDVAQPGTGAAEIGGASFSMPACVAAIFTTSQTTFAVMP